MSCIVTSDHLSISLSLPLPPPPPPGALGEVTMSQGDADCSVLCWLSGLRLSQYYPCFQAAGVTSLAQCRTLTPEWLEQVGVTLPGHRRRIVASLGRTMTAALQDGGEDDDDHHQPEVPLPDRPLPLPRERTKRRGEGGGRGGGVGRERPIPRQRTKFRHAATTEDPDLPAEGPSHSPTATTPLPPVPPRSAPNCPPQPFTAPGPSLPSPQYPRPDTLSLSLPPPPPPRPDGRSPLSSPGATKTPPPLPPKASINPAPPPLPQRPPLPPSPHHPASRWVELKTTHLHT